MKRIQPYFTGICILVFALVLLLTDFYGWFYPKDSLARGKLFFDQGNYVKAVDSLSQAVRSCDNNIVAQFYLGAAYHQYGWHDEALDQYQKTWALAQTATRAMHSAARIYHNRGQKDQAINHYQMALALSPSSPDIWHELGTVFKEIGNEAAAQGAFIKAQAYGNQ